MSLNEVLNLDMPTFDRFRKFIPIVKSQEKLSDMDVVAYPNLKKEAQRKMHRDLHRVADPPEFREDTATNMEHVMAKLNKESYGR